MNIMITKIENRPHAQYSLQGMKEEVNYGYFSMKNYCTFAIGGDYTFISVASDTSVYSPIRNIYRYD